MKFMLRFIKLTLVLGLLAGSSGPVRAFSLLGIWDTWQAANLGYQIGEDIGGPMGLTEGYRWNVPVITYSFDRSFLLYFGQRGVDEVEKAIAVFNQLPNVSLMSSNLTEYPLDSRRINYQAQALGIWDVKSTVMANLVELLGLAEPERYTWCLRDRQTYTQNQITITNYLVIQRNFDPISWVPTKLVNGTIYSYQIQEPILPGNYADAVEFVTDPLALTFTSVASKQIPAGSFYTGLTRDDVGGLRYLYRSSNVATENLVAGVSNSLGGAVGGGYMIIWPTNAVTQTNIFGGGGTNTIVDAAVRPGIGKIFFQRVDYDSLVGQTLVPYYYDYADTFITNSRPVSQNLRRTITTPDIVFIAADLGVTGGAVLRPVDVRRNVSFVSNDALNGVAVQAGPGVLQAPAEILFTTLLPAFLNDDTYFDEATAVRTMVWGAYDGTTNAPVVFPSILSIQDIERQVQNR